MKRKLSSIVIGWLILLYCGIAVNDCFSQTVTPHRTTATPIVTDTKSLQSLNRISIRQANIAIDISKLSQKQASTAFIEIESLKQLVQANNSSSSLSVQTISSIFQAIGSIALLIFAWKQSNIMDKQAVSMAAQSNAMTTQYDEMVKARALSFFPILVTAMEDDKHSRKKNSNGLSWSTDSKITLSNRGNSPAFEVKISAEATDQDRSQSGKSLLGPVSLNTIIENTSEDYLWDAVGHFMQLLNASSTLPVINLHLKVEYKNAYDKKFQMTSHWQGKGQVVIDSGIVAKFVWEKINETPPKKIGWD